MKKKLLITMGCSWTEGYGCYHESTIPNKVKKNRNIKGFNLGQIQSQNLDRFHEFGWPVRLAKKLGYDKLINLGLGGSSTSGQLKRYYESYYDENFEEYDVTIIWLLTHPTRFSFYTQYAVYDIMPAVQELNNLGHIEKDSLAQKYLEYTHDWQVDSTLEQLFHIKSMEQLCQNRNFKLIISHTDVKADALLKYYYDSTIYLNPIPGSILEILDVNTEQSYICNHPNEIGYEKLANFMYRQITRYHYDVINRDIITEPELEWSWNGGPRMSWFNPDDMTMEELIGADYIHRKLIDGKDKRYIV